VLLQLIPELTPKTLEAFGLKRGKRCNAERNQFDEPPGDVEPIPQRVPKPVDQPAAQYRKYQIGCALSGKLEAMDGVLAAGEVSFTITELAVHVQEVVGGAGNENAWRFAGQEGIALTQSAGLPEQGRQAVLPGTKHRERPAQLRPFELGDTPDNVRACERSETDRTEKDVPGPAGPLPEWAGFDSRHRLTPRVVAGLPAKQDRVPGLDVFTEERVRLTVEKRAPPCTAVRCHCLTASAIVLALVIGD